MAVSANSGDVADDAPLPLPHAAQRWDIVRRAARLVRAEDWLLAGLVLLVAPAFAGPSAAGPFDAGQPVQGAVRLGAVLAALGCAAVRRPVPAAGGTSSSLVGSGAVGPFSGAVLLIAASGGAALSLPAWGPQALVLAGVVVMAAAHWLLPPLAVPTRRLLMTPFVLVAGSLFWSLIREVFAGPLVQGPLDRASLVALAQSPAFLFLVAFSAVYYAMLVFAPRQVAEREGGLAAWLVRYALFLAGVVFGIGWLGALGG